MAGRHLKIYRVLLGVALLLVAWPGNVARSDDAGLQQQVLAVLDELAPPPSNEALAQIPDLSRKLLALRSYVRIGSRLAERWSWTDEQIKAFEGSAEKQALLAEIDAVSAHFAEANPGYQIYVHGTVRSLDEQIRKWNSNASVGVAAAEVLESWTAAFGGAEQVDAGKARKWLAAFRPSKRANLAAPGLTRHGRAHAIDFQVMKDGAIYAGANLKQVESLWSAEGWAAKLKNSIMAAGPSFTGPLTNPDEPWHYDYEPEKAASSD